MFLNSMMNIKRFFIVEFAVYIFLDMIEMFNKESSVELIIDGPSKTSVMVLSYNIKIFIYFVSHQILSKVQCQGRSQGFDIGGALSN